MGPTRPTEDRDNGDTPQSGPQQDQDLHAPHGASDRADAPTPDVYTLLTGTHIDKATLARAEAIAKRAGVPVQDVLLAHGWLSPEDYFKALARSHGLNYVADNRELHPPPPEPASGTMPGFADGYGVVRHIKKGSDAAVLAPSASIAQALPSLVEGLGAGRDKLGLTDPRLLRARLLSDAERSLTQTAIHGLTRIYPEASAEHGMAPWQRWVPLAAVALVTFCAVLQPVATIAAVSAVLSTLFLAMIALRFIACLQALRALPRRSAPNETRRPDSDLPVYSILVPMFREAEMVPQLVRALGALDYPAPKLDIKLILEREDTETINAVATLDLPACFEMVVVPRSHPQTKPKALNYALPLARGDYLVIYDAEDVPERDQLRRALAAFEHGPDNLACLQSKLNTYNAKQSWLAGQFTIEYTALFDALLPTLQALRLPIPLGGTSNHFRVSHLRALGAWDAFNVTEDADLGIRMARHGLVCHVLSSTTYEEASATWPNWLQQRTRWLKGYLKTYMVHMRAPRRLWRDLGARGFLGFQAMIGGTVITAIAYPFFICLLAILWLTGLLPGYEALRGDTFALIMAIIAGNNLVLGYAVSMALSWIALARRGAKGLYLQVFAIPVYWLCIGAAAYRALMQVVSRPFHWEKTLHGNGNSNGGERENGSS